MRSCFLKKTTALLSALLLVLCLFVPQAALAAAPGGINTESALRMLIENAKDGDTLLVDDIVFTSLEDPVVISKSLTIRTYKDHGPAIWNGGAFVLDGSAGKISVTFDNIIFYSNGDAAEIMDEIWDQDEVLPPAVTFRGNVDAVLSDCVFRNYVSQAGANLSADYADTDARLSLTAKNCSFLGSAVCQRGGAVLLVGKEGSDNVLFTAEDCAFTGNISSNRKTALGGGAVYAENAALEFVGCSFTSNEASHQYLLKEAAEGEEAEQTPAYPDYKDKTKGGAVYAKNSRLSMTDCTVCLNSASLGGGLALENSSLVFFGGILAHNRAETFVPQADRDAFTAGTGMGGGLYIAADKEVSADFVNSSIYGNSAFNAYGGLYPAGAGTQAQPYTVNLMLCTYASNTADTAYERPEVDRDAYFPKETETSSDNQEDSETDPEEAAKKAEEAAKKAEEARKQAEEAYAKAQADALAKVAWISVPGNIWETETVKATASLVIDDSFSSLKRNKAAYPCYAQPTAENGLVYYAAPETALAEGYMPNVPSAEFTHVPATDAFREAFPLDDSVAAGILFPFFDEVIGSFALGDNQSGGLSYELYLNGMLWKEIEAEGTTPELPVPDGEGYHFDAWLNEDGTAYTAGTTYITGPAKVVRKVSASMAPNTYTLHFVSEAGTEDVQQVYGEPVVLPAASEKKNYNFVNWYKSDGTVASDGEVYTVLGDSTYTAQYTKQFPKTAVIALSGAIALIVIYLLGARIADAAKKAKAQREIAEAEAAARAEEEAKRRAEEEAAAQAAAEKAAQEQAAAEAEKTAKETAEDGLAAAVRAENAAQAEAEAAVEAAKNLAEAMEEFSEDAEGIIADAAEADKKISD